MLALAAPIIPKLVYESRRGRRFEVRLARPADKAGLVEMLQSLSAQTCLLRFMVPLPRVSPEMAQAQVARLTRPDPNLQITLLATTTATLDGSEKVLAIAEMVCLKPGDEPELAIVVRDDYQREGLGSIILPRLGQLALARNIKTLQATVLAENIGIRRLLQKLNIPYSSLGGYGSERLLRIELAA